MHGNKWTDQGKRNTLLLLCFPWTLKGKDFRYRAQKCSNSSLPFLHARKLLSWLLMVQPPWTGYSRIKLWPSIWSFATPLTFNCSPYYLKRSLNVPLSLTFLSQPSLGCFVNIPFCKGMIAEDTIDLYHTLQ